MTTHCDEFETEVTNRGRLEKILASLNFQTLITVHKERTTYRYQDEFEIALDTVKDLGNFIEIEALKDFGGITATRKAVEEFAKNLGLNLANQDLRGYPYLLMKKFGLIKSDG